MTMRAHVRDRGDPYAAFDFLVVSRDDAPILLIHGDKDDVVPLEQSEKIEAALRQAEVATKLLRVPGAGHDMRPNSQNVDFVSEMVRWFDNHLRR